MVSTIAHYRILKRLGEGGMGEVYQAEDLRLGRAVALKFLSTEAGSDQQARERLLAEARAIAALNHPHIAAIYDLIESTEGDCLVIEYVEGETLAEQIRAAPFSLECALQIAEQLSETLSAVHARGIVHCDLKGANIMVDAAGQVKLLDFGLVRLGRPPPGPGGGTLGYLSPEQVRGEELDERTDLFSLGVVIYEMLTGRRPFDRENRAATLRAILEDEPLPLGRLCDRAPLALEQVVRRALEKRKEERYRSAGELLEDLARVRRQVESATERRQRGPAPVGPAFRGLLPFQEADRERFYGREAETEALVSMIAERDYRFGLLFGESGCGKTSLIRAGLIPRLWQDGCVPIYCRSYRNPLSAVIAGCAERSRLSPREGEAPVDYLRRAAELLDATLVIICDQFEEFFIHSGDSGTKTEREPFTSFISACYHAADLPVKILCSLRSDFLHQISAEFDDRIPEPLLSRRRRHLRNFGRPQSEEIIARLARDAHLPLEADLIRQVVSDLAEDGAIRPSELQIVGAQLQSKRLLTRQAYRRAGGREPLVYSFLEDVIQSSGDREGAHLLLRSLISEQNARAMPTLDEIRRQVQRRPAEVERLLRLFVEARLVREMQCELQEDEPQRYELMHEYLIAKINRITGKMMDARGRANRMWRQYCSEYAGDRATRIPLGKLWFIRRYADFGSGARAQELLRRSWRAGLLKVGGAALFIFALISGAAIWSAASVEWEETRLRDGHSVVGRKVIFSPQGRLLVSCGEDKQIIVWDFARRERLATFSDHQGWVTAIAFSPEGKWFATASVDGTVIAWDAVQLKKAAVLTGHQGVVRTIAFTDDGRFLVTPTDDDRKIFWEVGSWEKAREASTGRFHQGSFHLSPDGRRMLSPTWSIHDLTTGEMIANLHLPSWTWGAFSSDSKRFMTIESGGFAAFWETTGLWESRAPQLLDRIHAHDDHGRAVAYAPDGDLAASGAEDIILWDARARTKLARFEHPAYVSSLAFSPDGRSLVSMHGDGAILLWDVIERERAASFNEHSAPVRTVSFAADARRLASAGEDRSVIIWDLEQRRKQAVLLGHQTQVTGVAFTPDGNSVASCDQNGNLIFWDLEGRRPRWIHHAVNKSEDEASYGVAISPDARWVATSYGVYRSADGRLAVDFRTEDRRFRELRGIAFSADGRWLVGASARGEVFVWEGSGRQLIASRKLSNANFVSLSISPDGRWLVTGEDQGAIRLWETTPLREVAVLGRHQARVKSVAFGPDGREVASASDDQTIALWDVARRRLLRRIGAHAAPVLSIAFSSDGQRLAAGLHDRSVRLYTRHRTLWGRRLD